MSSPSILSLPRNPKNKFCSVERPWVLVEILPVRLWCRGGALAGDRVCCCGTIKSTTAEASRFPGGAAAGLRREARGSHAELPWCAGGTKIKPRGYLHGSPIVLAVNPR